MAGEYDATGNEQRTYGYQPGSPWSTNPLFIQIDDIYYWYQNDHLGTPQKIIAGNGALVWQGMQDAFGGMEVTVDDITNNLRFPGQYFDAEKPVLPDSCVESLITEDGTVVIMGG